MGQLHEEDRRTRNLIFGLQKLWTIERSPNQVCEIMYHITVTGADPGYVKWGGRDPKGGAGWLILSENSPKIT